MQTVAVLPAAGDSATSTLGVKFTAIYKDRRSADITTIARADQFVYVLAACDRLFVDRPELLRHLAYVAIIELGRGAVAYFAPRAFDHHGSLQGLPK